LYGTRVLVVPKSMRHVVEVLQAMRHVLKVLVMLLLLLLLTMLMMLEVLEGVCRVLVYMLKAIRHVQ
jgi:hypothetical protein